MPNLNTNLYQRCLYAQASDNKPHKKTINNTQKQQSHATNLKKTPVRKSPEQVEKDNELIRAAAASLIGAVVSVFFFRGPEPAKAVASNMLTKGPVGLFYAPVRFLNSTFKMDTILGSAVFGGVLGFLTHIVLWNMNREGKSIQQNIHKVIQKYAPEDQPDIPSAAQMQDGQNDITKNYDDQLPQKPEIDPDNNSNAQKQYEEHMNEYNEQMKFYNKQEHTSK